MVHDSEFPGWMYDKLEIYWNIRKVRTYLWFTMCQIPKTPVIMQRINKNTWQAFVMTCDWHATGGMDMAKSWPWSWAFLFTLCLGCQMALRWESISEVMSIVAWIDVELASNVRCCVSEELNWKKTHVSSPIYCLWLHWLRYTNFFVI